MALSSDQSYQDFLRQAFFHLTNPGPVRPDAGLAVRNLYHLYCYYDSNPMIPAKAPLADNDLYRAMIELLEAANFENKKHIIRVQHTPPNQNVTFSIMDQDKALLQYGNLSRSSDITYQLAITAMKSYLHVYPSDTRRLDQNTNELSRPIGRSGIIDWRIGINVDPISIAAAVLKFLPVVDKYPDIHHIKFAAPAFATKSDSIIFYLRKQPNTYKTIRKAVKQASQNLKIQPKFAPMWNEFAAGLGEAADAPRRDLSFGIYRCILAYLAFPVSRIEAAALSFPQYLDSVDDMFERFGIPRYMPHEQGRLYIPPVDAALQRRFMVAKALYDGKSFDAYQDSKLFVHKSEL